MTTPSSPASQIGNANISIPKVNVNGKSEKNSKEYIFIFAFTNLGYLSKFIFVNGEGWIRTINQKFPLEVTLSSLLILFSKKALSVNSLYNTLAACSSFMSWRQN